MTRPCLAALLPLLLVVGCAQQPPPLLSLAGHSCDRAPRLELANTMALGSVVNVRLDAGSPCVDTPAGPATYTVVALPATDGAYRITVRSQRSGTELLSPTAVIYGADARPRRDLGEFRGELGTLVASATGEPGDRYLVVASTPGTVGTRQRIPTAAETPRIRLAAAVIIPIIIPVVPAGPTTDAVDVVFAHSGRISVSADRLVTLR